MAHSLKVLFAVAEASPLVKVGGLGDVAGSLPQALRKAGHDVRIVMPHYSPINLGKYQNTLRDSFILPFMSGQQSIRINEVVLQDGLSVYLVENEKYFDRLAIYGEPDDLERFLLFSQAVMEVPKKLNWQPDILHSHDWHTGIIPALLKVAYRDDPFYSSCASVYTIHNTGYQGWFDDWFAGRAGLYSYLPPQNDSIRSRAYSMTALGIYHAEVISTVSETYAREILTPEYGFGLEALLQRRLDSLFGILNGINYDEFDPATDPLIAVNYDVHSLDRRGKNKLACQMKVGLPPDKETLLVGMVGRLVEQKGVDIAVGALKDLLAHANIQFISLGTGETRYQESLKMLESLYPGKVHTFLTWDLSLAQLIFAGCDVFLVPSRFEPCGLSPLIAMRYGAIPVVRRTGGLADTVEECSPDLSSGLGFVFEKYDVSELIAALRRALTAFYKKDEWHRLMVRAMKADFSWDTSRQKYEALYEVARRKVMR